MRTAVASLAGVRVATLASTLPVQQHHGGQIVIDGTTAGEPTTGVRVLATSVTPEFFTTFGGRLTHEQMAANMLVSYKMMSLIFVSLGGAALFLAAAGLYAVMSFSVTQRTREIGIRLALGATGPRVTAVVLRQGLRQIAIGLVLGSMGGWLLMRLIAIIPIGMSAAGPWLLALAASVMLATGIGACLTPMVRVLRIHPVEALRHD